MKNIKIKFNDQIDIEICTDSRIIIIKNYSDKCVMTINYPDNWYYTRAVQHATSITECCFNENNPRIN